MSNFEPNPSDRCDSDPLYPGSTAWFDPGMQRIFRPWEVKSPTAPSEVEESGFRLPMWAYLPLALPVVGAILSTDPATPALVRWGWFPALILAAAFVGWRLLRRAD